MSQPQAFTVRYIDVDGSRRSMSVTGIDQDHARRRAVEQSVADSRIIGVTKGISLVELWQQLNEKKTGDIDRMLIYTQMGALVASGCPSLQIEDLVRSMRGDTPAMGDSTVSEWLGRMGFPDTELAPIEAAESAGQLAAGLADASEQLTLQLKIKKDTGKQFSMAVVVFLMAATSMLLMPLTTGGSLDMIAKQVANPRMVITTTFMTDILFWQRDLYSALPGFPLLFPLILGGVGYWKWQLLLKTRLFRPMDQMYKADLSIRFLLSWRPLYKAGTPVRTAMEKASAVLPEELAQTMTSVIHRGGALSSALDKTKEQWSRTLVMGLKGADDIVGDDKTALMDKLILALSMEQSTQASKAARVLYLAAALLGIGAIFMQLLGAMLPMMTMGIA
ncbi:MAG: hypothetical protein JAZ11_02705 [Candidatus Thiodiazotropha lotti]|nr:hypothetical protein [Candidatus Thiodiazotropha lotti]